MGAWSSDQYAEDSGNAYLYQDHGGSWANDLELRQSDPERGGDFGISVAVQDHDVIVGAYGNQPGAAYAYWVPDLVLDVEVLSLILHATTVLGQANGLVMLAIVAIDGTPRFKIIDLAFFDANGIWEFSALTPPGYRGIEVTVQTFGITARTGRAAASLPKTFVMPW